LTVLKKTECRIICLSATFEDKNEIKGWLKAELVEVPEQFRKIKLKNGYVNLINTPKAKLGEAFDDWLKNAKLFCPMIIFCSTRPWSRSRALQLSKVLPSTFSKEEEESLKKEFVARVSRELTGLENDLFVCLLKKVAFHHSGLHKNLKELVEQKFLKKEIDYMFATSGLAYGVNSPAKTVVLHDLSMPTIGGKVDYVPTYMFIQMAGRAGRPQFGKDGYTFIVLKNGADKLRAEKLYQGKLERAFSQINNDDYFQKFILELIFSQRSKSEDLIGFFEDSFYYYQSTRPGQRSLASFDFDTILSKQIENLTTCGFIEYLGAPGFRLLPLGKVTVDFLLNTYQLYKLRDFVEINKFLDKNRTAAGFDLILELNQQFEGSGLYKIPQEQSERIESFYIGRGITKPSHAEYSAFAIYNGWLENITESQIETDFKVYSSAIENVSSELLNLLVMYEKLAKSKFIDLPPDWQDFKDRVSFGVRQEELPFVRIKGIKRNIVRNLYNYCKNTLGGPLYGYKGNMMQVLSKFCDEKGESMLLTQLVEEKMNIGPARASAILEIINQNKK
jgi:helicase